MRDLKQFFSYMNDISFPYVVLRNWENLPYEAALGEHSDLDLLVYDYHHFFEIFPMAVKVLPLPRVRVKMPIADTCIYVDLRHLGDDYYPIDFERAILNNREWNDRGFFTPNAGFHAAALAYHAVHHKNGIAKEYERHLGNATLEELLAHLRESQIGWVAPKDPSVGRYHGYWKGATSFVEKRGVYFAKKQLSYLQYPLIKNEAEMLNRFDSSEHCPSGYFIDKDGALCIADCGDHLTHKNLPENWRDQLKSILFDLRSLGIKHRDIKVDNLMVKDGILKLIDFGWAVPDEKRGGEFELLENAPPSCLGYPNQCPTGFDDGYSMRRVQKQIEFMLEEQEVLA